jgi:hypothetical protein
MKEDQPGAELDGLRQSKGESPFIGGNLAGKENGGGLAPTRLDGSGHGNLLKVRRMILKFAIDLTCPAAVRGVTMTS